MAILRPVKFGIRFISRKSVDYLSESLYCNICPHDSCQRLLKGLAMLGIQYFNST